MDVSHLQYRRNVWQKALKAFCDADVFEEDKAIPQLHSASKDYIIFIDNFLKAFPSQNLLSERNLVATTLYVAETLASQHLDKPYGIHPELTARLDEDTLRSYADLEKRIESLSSLKPHPWIGWLSRQRGIHPIMRFLRFDPYSQSIKKAQLRGKMILERQLLLSDVVLEQLIKSIPEKP